jgi:hypothetical protein
VVLYPPAGAKENKEQHRKEVEKILDVYGLIEDQALREAWLSLAGEGKGLSSVAHRRNLAAPRRRDVEFENLVDRVEGVLSVVLRRFEERYSDLLPQLDDLAALEAPSHDDVSALRSRFPQNPVTLQYLFERISSPAWLEPLADAGYFREPPEPEVDEDGRIGFIAWPASRLLVRLVEAAPDLVAGIAAAVPATENFRVYDDLCEIAAKLDAALALTLVPQVLAGLRLRYRGLAHEQLGVVVTKLAGAGYLDEAFEITRELLAIQDSGPDGREVQPGA